MVKILLLTVLPAVVIACIVGVVAGKHQVKKANNQVRRVLSTRQRIVYTLSILVGIACVATGIFYKPADAVDVGGMGDMGEMGMGDYGEMGGFEDGKGELPMDDMEGGADIVDDPLPEGGIENPVGIMPLDGEEEAELTDEEPEVADPDGAEADPEPEPAPPAPSTGGGGGAVMTPTPRANVRIIGGGTASSVTIVG